MEKAHQTFSMIRTGKGTGGDGPANEGNKGRRFMPSNE